MPADSGMSADTPFPTYRPASPDRADARTRDLLSSSTSVTPTDSGSMIRPIHYEAPTDPARTETLQGYQEMLMIAGAQGQRAEQLAGGEWIYSCTVGPKLFEGRGRDQVEALRKVLEQVKNGR